jgi:hypothetical protein
MKIIIEGRHKRKTKQKYNRKSEDVDRDFSEAFVSRQKGRLLRYCNCGGGGGGGVHHLRE